MQFDILKHLVDTERDTLVYAVKFLYKDFLPEYGITLKFRTGSMSNEKLLDIIRKYYTPAAYATMCNEGYGMDLCSIFDDETEDAACDYWDSHPKEQERYDRALEKWYNLVDSVEDDDWKPDLSKPSVKKIVETITGIKV